MNKERIRQLDERLNEDYSWLPEHKLLVDLIDYQGSETEKGMLARSLCMLREVDLCVEPVPKNRNRDAGCIPGRLHLYHSNVDLEAEVLNTAIYTDRPTFGLGIKIPTNSGESVYVVIPDMLDTNFGELADLTKAIESGKQEESVQEGCIACLRNGWIDRANELEEYTGIKPSTKKLKDPQEIKTSEDRLES